MASYIKTLKEDNGDITYPQTIASAVFTSGGSDVETEMGKYVTAENIATTSALTPPVTTGMIQDGAVTAAKIDSASIASSALYPGKTLVTARCATTYGPGTLTNHTIVSSGTWYQYGAMADSSYAHRLKLENTTSETMTIELELSCSTVNTPASRVTCTGIVECNSAGSAYTSLLGQTILSANNGQTNIWAPAHLKKVITVAPGATRYFAVSVQVNGSGAYWLGGDVKSGSAIGLDTNFAGDSFIFSATLISAS